jgi:hypothetical protein
VPEYRGAAYGQDHTCQSCGSIVDAALDAAHNRWHAEIEALIARALGD